MEHILNTSSIHRSERSLLPVQSRDSERAAHLLEQMSLAEKIGQLCQFSANEATGPDSIKGDQNTLAEQGHIGSMLNFKGAARVNELQRHAVEGSRLGIPILFAYDIIHGHRTIYPIPLGISASWDPDLAERCARMAAIEGAAEGIRWTFSPMVDIGKDARWGRVMEGSGEDPYLGSIFARAMVRGYQTEDLKDPTALLACAKHLAGYGACHGGRDYDAADVPERTLRQTYLPPFHAALKAGVATMMSGFHSNAGVPASADPMVLTQILRDEWGFDGFVVSDYNSIGELIHHGVARDLAEAASKAFNAGVDMDMQSNAYIGHLKQLIDDGLVEEERVNSAVHRILTLKFALGLFDNPYTDESAEKRVLVCKEHRALAREAAERSFVLLKNEPGESDPALPISPDTSIAVVGPNARAGKDLFGPWAWAGEEHDAAPIDRAMLERFGERCTIVDGYAFDSKEPEDHRRAIDAAKAADLVVLAVGESWEMCGEARSRSRITLPESQRALIRATARAAKRCVLVVTAGRPLDISEEVDLVDSVLLVWFPGVEAGPAIARTLAGDAAPSGRLTMAFPYSAGQLPLYYDRVHVGRPPSHDGSPVSSWNTGYIDEYALPRFPFGFGLTYSEFQYSDTTVSARGIDVSELAEGGSLIASATVQNTGRQAAVETVQCYIGLRGTSVAQPVKKLIGFERMHIEPSEILTVSFPIQVPSLAFWDNQMRFSVEPCTVDVTIAPNAAAGHAATFEITGAPVLANT